MQDAPSQPLDELETLRKENKRFRKQISGLLSEVYVVRSAVEAIYSHENESDACNDKGDSAGSCAETDLAGTLTNALETCHITLREDENDSEIIHVYSHDTRWQTFSRADWGWMYDNGKWPWEEE